ncbi:MAG: hypothetical protein ABI054_07490 [Planctomycetota bacterium]
MNGQAVFCGTWLAALLLVPQLPPTTEGAKPVLLAAPLRVRNSVEEAIDSNPYGCHSGPLFADLDGDGKSELLVGNLKGHFQLYANVGEPGAPKLVARGLLKSAGKDAHVENW